MSIDLNDDDDVLSMATNADFVGARTFTIGQLRQEIGEQFKRTSNGGLHWIEDGMACRFLQAKSAEGWKTGKVRLRLEFVPDEPEPSPDESFLDSLRTNTNSDQQ